MKKKIFNLTEKAVIGEYVIEFSNFSILIKKNGSIVKCIDINMKDFSKVKYTEFIDRFKQSYNKRL